MGHLLLGESQQRGRGEDGNLEIGSVLMPFITVFDLAQVS